MIDEPPLKPSVDIRRRIRAAILAALYKHTWLDEVALVKLIRAEVKGASAIEVYRSIDTLRCEGTLGKWRCQADRRIVWGFRIE